MRIWFLLCAACGASSLDAPDAPTGDGQTDASEQCHASAPTATRGPTTKVAQVTGEDDRERGQKTTNETLSRVGLWGTDLGASFEHDGRTVVLFGDSIPTGANTPNPPFGDAIAFTTDTDPSDGLSLTFDTHDDGTFRSPVVPGVALGEYEVPLDGIGISDTMFVWFSTDTMTRSVLAKSDNDGRTFAFVHDLSNDKLVNVSAVAHGDHVYLFGSGKFRESDMFLARVPADQITDRSAYEFFTGHGTCAPIWSASEADAVPLFDHPCVGELSVHRIAALDAWVALYNCGEPRGIQARIAHAPAGPWSEPITIFEPWQDGGYCHFMHTSYDFMQCDSVHDPGREAHWGGEYGPYVVESLSESLAPHRAALYFVLSTWNPYNTVLVRSELGWN